MLRILLLYGTTDGHTAKIARVLGEMLRQHGALVDVVDAGAAGPGPRAADYDGILVAASVHISSYQRGVQRWVRKHSDELKHKPSAFLSVCLGVLQHEPAVQKDLDVILERFFVRTRWRPALTKIVAGALPYSRYGRLKRWAMRRMARRAGVETDPSRDYEYTDWNEVRAFTELFERLVP